jgi:hypothetical protein
MAALEQVAIPARPRVDETGVANAPRPWHGRSLRRSTEPELMVGHQAIGPDLDAVPARLFGEHVAIDVVVAILEENRLAAIARCVT